MTCGTSLDTGLSLVSSTIMWLRLHVQEIFMNNIKSHQMKIKKIFFFFINISMKLFQKLRSKLRYRSFYGVLHYFWLGMNKMHQSEQSVLVSALPQMCPPPSLRLWIVEKPFFIHLTVTRLQYIWAPIRQMDIFIQLYSGQFVCENNAKKVSTELTSS